jgi:hypothetical protein
VLGCKVTVTTWAIREGIHDMDVGDKRRNNSILLNIILPFGRLL